MHVVGGLKPFGELASRLSHAIDAVKPPGYLMDHRDGADPTQDPKVPLTSYASNLLVFGTTGANQKTAFPRGAANTLVLMERYARNDTHFLKPLAERLKPELESRGRLSWRRF